MTPNDLDLIDKATKLHYTEHDKIDSIVRDAFSMEAKRKLREIQAVLFEKQKYYEYEKVK